MKYKFGYLMLILALAVASCAAYFSVWGLSQLFAGAGAAVIVMASVLEISKVAATTALHRYWGDLKGVLKTYATVAIIVMMVITSAGIYGFLSNAYQKTANKLEIHEGEIGVLDNKKILFEKTISDNEKNITNKNKRIDQLIELRATQENRLDKSTTNTSKSRARNDIKVANDEIDKLSSEVDVINIKNAALSDSIGNYNTQILTLNTNSEVASEVGPLKYISNLTGQSMDKVVNILILLLIFVFDPFAIALILITNRIFEIENEKDEVPALVVESNEAITQPVLVETPTEAVSVPIVTETRTEAPKPPLRQRNPVIPTGKVTLDDIRGVNDRGFSVNVPNPKSNSIERIGSNKIVKNGNSDKVIFKRNS
jgi:hypothetical protein